MGANHDAQGARIRAARAYAGIGSQKALGERIGLGRDAVIAMEADEREPTVPELRRIADACDIPLSFLVNGWETPPGLEERVAALEQSVSLALQDRDALAQAFEDLNADYAKQVPELMRRLQRLEDRLGAGEQAQ